MTKLLCRNYDHVSALWEEEGWIPSSAAQQAKAHYAGYSVNRGDGLRIIVLNTDICMSLHIYANSTYHSFTGYMCVSFPTLESLV